MICLRLQTRDASCKPPSSFGSFLYAGPPALRYGFKSVPCKTHFPSRSSPDAKSLCRSHLSLISDPEKLAAYAKLAAPAIALFGARFLARGNAVVAREQWVKERTVIVNYPQLGEGERGI